MTSKRPRHTEIDTDDTVYAVAFTANSEYLVTGGTQGVRIWQAKDGEKVATMQLEDTVGCVAASKDGRWIAAGSYGGEVFVLDVTTYKRVFLHKGSKPSYNIDITYDVDFSPDSARLVAASSRGYATVWDFSKHKQVLTLHHTVRWMIAAKYSLQGDRIATVAVDSIRVWDSNDGHLLVDIDARVNMWHGLLGWSNNHLFIITNHSEIKQIDASTGSTVSEWPVPSCDALSCVALPQPHGRFIAYSTKDTITFWNCSTHTQLGVIQHPHHIRSMALSRDGQLLAIATEAGKVVVKELSVSLFTLTLEEPEICIDTVALESWKHNQLVKAEALLNAAITRSQDTAHHVLASRALIRARLGWLDAAIDDSEESIKTYPSVVGYIAKCVSLVAKGKRREAYRACDIAFEYFHSTHLTILLLVKAIVAFLAGEHEDAILRVNDLITEVYSNPTFHIVQAYMLFLHGKLQMERGDHGRAIQSFEKARGRLGDHTHRPPLILSLISGWKFDDLAFKVQHGLCEALYTAGRANEAVESLLRMVNQKVDMTEPTKLWVSDFMQRCLSTSDHNGPTDQEASRRNKAWLSQEWSDTSHPMMPLLREWTRLRLTSGSWKDTLATADGFMLPRFTIYQVICERLETTGHVVDAVACFHQMRRELQQEIGDEQEKWIRNFQARCHETLEGLGDAAMNTDQYEEAILQYTAALLLNPIAKQHLLIKRSKARAAKELWEDALNDADDAIKLDPSSPLGYERKHEALCGAGYYADAIDTFETMLSRMAKSPDRGMRERSRSYIRPAQTKEMIRKVVKSTIRDSPLVLIDTASGRLCNKSEQASAFELMPAFTKLTALTTTRTDLTAIEQVVEEFYRYATFSHTWEDNEPLFEQVVKIVVYDLGGSPTHAKLQMFCKIVRDAGFNWAWSDTCCIDKGDHFVLQEALVSMFKWYEGSAMTIVFLRGVHRLAQRGALMNSIWNMRGWTLQEYHASKVVRFYTEDWTPYLGLEIHNHKESPEIISEMEDATNMSAQALMTLRPGLDDIREKLRLASTRQTTRVEDAAYSLLGIFSVSLPIVYGEGDRALGRLLAQLLMSSGDTSILAWTGKSGILNSCFPASISVFNGPPTSHIPAQIISSRMETNMTGLRASPPSLTLATKLYDRLLELPVPSVAGCRLKLPCLTFKLGRVQLSSQNSSECIERVFRAQTHGLGVVEIVSEQDLSQFSSLYLVHPWVDFLLDRQPVGSVALAEDTDRRSNELTSLPELSNATSTGTQTQPGRLITRLGRSPKSDSDAASLQPPSTVSPMEKQTRVNQFIARLRQPFGALLLTPVRRNVEECKRVAAESVITSRVEEITPTVLDKLIQNVRVLDVL